MLPLEWPHHKTKYNPLIGAVTHKQESRHKVPKSVLRAVLGRMEFTPFYATRRTPHSRPLRAWCKRCLPGWWKPGVLRPGIVRMRGSIVTRIRPWTNWVPPPPHPRPVEWRDSSSAGYTRGRINIHAVPFPRDAGEESVFQVRHR